MAARDRVEIIERVDDKRVIGKRSLIAEVEKDLTDAVDQIVLPAFQQGIRRRLGETRNEHKYRNDGSIRTPLAEFRGGSREAHGSETEEQAYVDLERKEASGEGAGRGGTGTAFGVSMGSYALTHDREFHTLPFLIEGRAATPSGVIDSPVRFWGRYPDDEGAITTHVRHVAIPESDTIESEVLDDDVLGRLSERFAEIVEDVLTGDNLRDYKARLRWTKSR